MNHDHTFRIILILGLLVVLPIGIYHRLKSQATGEKLDRWQEGLFILFTLRTAGVVGWLGIIAYLVNPSWMAWSSVPLPDWLRWTGVGVFVMAGGVAYLDLPQPRQEPDGYRGNAEGAHAGDQWPVRFGQPPVL